MVSRLCLLLVCGCLLAGCGDPEEVWIDTSQALVPEPPPLSATAPALPAIPGARNELPLIENQSLVASDVRSLTRAALQKARASQENLFRELRDRLAETYRAELEGVRQTTIIEVIQQYDEDLTQAFVDIRAKFEAHALQVGPLVHRLSWLAGFPDPDPRSRRTPRGTYIERKEAEESAKIRPEIDRLRAQYQAEVQEILSRLALDLRADLEALADEVDDKDRETLLRAESEAREQASIGLARLEESAFDARKVLEAVPGVVVQRDPVPAKPAEVWRAQNRDLYPQEERLRSEALIFARSRGWRLSKMKRGVPDRTQEFLEWRKSMGLNDLATSPGP
jgi:hypothetical protein